MKSTARSYEGFIGSVNGTCCCKTVYMKMNAACFCMY